MQLSKEVVHEALELADVDPTAMRYDYPGGGALGPRCPGLRVDSERDFYKFLCALGIVMANASNIDPVFWLAENARTDSMGKGVVFYWPHLTLTD